MTRLIKKTDSTTLVTCPSFSQFYVPPIILQPPCKDEKLHQTYNKRSLCALPKFKCTTEGIRRKREIKKGCWALKKSLKGKGFLKKLKKHPPFFMGICWVFQNQRVSYHMQKSKIKEFSRIIGTKISLDQSVC